MIKSQWKSNLYASCELYQVSSAEATVWAEGGGGADSAGQTAAELLPSAARGAGETAKDHRSERGTVYKLKKKRILLRNYNLLCIAIAISEDSEETLRVTKEVHKRAEEKYKVLENKMKNAEAEREKELKAAQQKLNTAKTKADAFNKKLKQMQQVN